MNDWIENHDLILVEGSVVERLRRDSGISLDPLLENAPLVYDSITGDRMMSIYQSYIDIARSSDLPFVMCTPTWRTNRERVEASDCPKSINQDVVRFLNKVRSQNDTFKSNIRIGGMLGCKYDCYLPEQGLDMNESWSFHQWQADQLAEGMVDFLIAQTMPNVQEARGMAKSLEATGLPYIISFVISRSGLILDGTPLMDAIDRIDDERPHPPDGYAINCAYPSFLNASQQPERLYERLIGYFANASSLDHCELEGAPQLLADPVEDWGNRMLELNTVYGIKMLGGCCGTGVEHIEYLSIAKLKNKLF